MIPSFIHIADILHKLADCFEEEPRNNKAQLRMIEKVTKELVDIILMLRNRFFIIANTDFKKRLYFDIKLNELVNIKIDKNEYGYTLTLPFLLPKRSHSLNRSLWHICLGRAVQEFETQYKEKINRINNPVVIFENQYVIQNTVKGLKDADNYELSDVLNFLQNVFYGDDRSVTLMIKNCGGFIENKTMVHIINSKNLIEYLKLSKNLLHQNN